jgi:hypothetical protein
MVGWHHVQRSRELHGREQRRNGNAHRLGDDIDPRLPAGNAHRLSDDIDSRLPAGNKDCLADSTN